MISQCIKLYQNSLVNENTDKSKKMRPKDYEAKEETVYKSVFIHLNM